MQRTRKINGIFAILITGIPLPHDYLAKQPAPPDGRMKHGKF